MKRSCRMVRAPCLTGGPLAIIDAARRLRADRSGAIALILGLGLPLLAGFASLAIDATGWMLAKTRAQGVADSAALSALAAVFAGETSTQAIAEAIAVAAAQGLKDGQNGVTVTVNNPPVSGAFIGNNKAFEVLITQQQETTFGKLFGVRPIVRGRSVAMNEGSSEGASCILALDPTASKALSLSGGGTLVTAPDCTIAVNSSSATAANLSGGASLSAKGFSVKGNYATSGSSTVTATVTRGVTKTDPYKDLAVPASTGCDYTSYSLGGGSGVINPGTYCGSITVSGGGHLTMNAGTYIIKGGNFKISSSSLTADGVSIVLTKDNSGTIGAVTVSGGGTVNLTAPSSGSMQGVAIYVDRTAASANNAISGGSTMAIKGSLYLPSQLVTYSGGSSGGSACLQLIANTIVFSGGSSFGSDCGSFDVPGLNTRSGKKGIPVE